MPARHPLRIWRERNDLSQLELAKKIGVKEATVSRWESRDRFPRGKILRRLANLTGISVAELLGVKQRKVKSNGETQTRAST
jgi:transcriptional regulator with XRE-family HTH domain